MAATDFDFDLDVDFDPDLDLDLVSARLLFRGLGVYALVLAVACVAVRAWVSLDGRAGEVVASVWRGGQLVERVVLPSADAHDPRLDAATKAEGSQLVLESIVGEAPLVASPEAALAMSLVAGEDGVKATLRGATAYVTPDDLLALQAYDHGISVAGLGLSVGANAHLVLALLSERLHAGVPDIVSSARLRRVRVARTSPQHPPLAWTAVSGPTLTPAIVRDAALDAARYLARGMRADGHFRFLVDASTNRTLSGYDWPRHAGATYFLAQAAAISHEPELSLACLRAAALMRESALSHCGDARCVGDEPTVDVGSSALALIAFVEIVRTGLDTSYRPLVTDLARFLRAQQRPDGEFMHEYDRAASHAVDVQFLYYSGEATLALSRAYDVTADGADLDAARRGLAHLVGPAWSFFGDRYYFGEEHWTCQAMADLWERAPDRDALDFCARWQAYGRKMQYGAGDSPFDADGAFGVGPVVTPRLTPVASRCEAGVATLAILSRERRGSDEIGALDAQLRRSLALLVRQQLRPGASHLFADPAAVYGAMPGSAVDWQLRIDYAQHAGSAMIRWLALEARPEESAK